MTRIPPAGGAGSSAASGGAGNSLVSQEDTYRPVPAMTGGIRLDELAVSYSGQMAVRGVSLAIPGQSITAMLGPSGCGKTSVLNTMNRMTDLIPGCCVEGSLTWQGCDLLDPRLDVRSLRRNMGMIFQRPNPFPMSIERNLELALREAGLRNRGEIRERIETALADVGLLEEVRGRLGMPATLLSGGQQQRLCLARALVLDPAVLLLDEPCSGLDPQSTAVVEALLRKLRERLTVVIITHNLGQAQRLADQVAVFWSNEGCGRLVESGPAERLFNAPAEPETRDYLQGRRG